MLSLLYLTIIHYATGAVMNITGHVVVLTILYLKKPKPK